MDVVMPIDTGPYADPAHISNENSLHGFTREHPSPNGLV